MRILSAYRAPGAHLRPRAPLVAPLLTPPPGRCARPGLVVAHASTCSLRTPQPGHYVRPWLAAAQTPAGIIAGCLARKWPEIETWMTDVDAIAMAAASAKAIATGMAMRTAMAWPKP